MGALDRKRLCKQEGVFGCKATQLQSPIQLHFFYDEQKLAQSHLLLGKTLTAAVHVFVFDRRLGEDALCTYECERNNCQIRRPL